MSTAATTPWSNAIGMFRTSQFRHTTIMLRCTYESGEENMTWGEGERYGYTWVRLRYFMSQSWERRWHRLCKNGTCKRLVKYERDNTYTTWFLKYELVQILAGLLQTSILFNSWLAGVVNTRMSVKSRRVHNTHESILIAKVCKPRVLDCDE